MAKWIVTKTQLPPPLTTHPHPHLQKVKTKQWTCKISCSLSRCFCCWYSLYSSLLESRTLPPDRWPWLLGVVLRSVAFCDGDSVLGGVGLPPVPAEDTWSERRLVSIDRKTCGGVCCCCSTRDERGEAILGSSMMEVRVSTVSPWAKSLSMDMSMGLRGWGGGGGGREDKVGAGAMERDRAARSPDVTWTKTKAFSLQWAKSGQIHFYQHVSKTHTLKSSPLYTLP